MRALVRVSQLTCTAANMLLKARHVKGLSRSIILASDRLPGCPSIHRDGMRQLDLTTLDGVGGVSQC